MNDTATQQTVQHRCPTAGSTCTCLSLTTKASPGIEHNRQQRSMCLIDNFEDSQPSSWFSCMDGSTMHRSALTISRAFARSWRFCLRPRRTSPDRRESRGEWSVSTVEPAKELTFWSRKHTAHVIGDNGGVTAVIERLRTIVKESRGEGRPAPEGTSLLMVGHSFGGALLYSAVATSLNADVGA